MVPIFITSTRAYSGKTFMALGLAMKLNDLGYKVGYVKPVGKTPIKKDGKIVDADAVFIKNALSLSEPLEFISPFVLSYEIQNLIYGGKIKEIMRRVMGSIAAMKKKDFVVIGGGADIFEGSLIKGDALSIIEESKAFTLMVEQWTGDVCSDSIFGGFRLIGERFLGAVINKVPDASLKHVKETVRPFMEKKGVRILGVFHRDSVLDSFTIRELNEVLRGKVLCCEKKLDEFVENYLIGAMDVESALKYFRRVPNKAVITGAHRADIQLAAMETSTKCIILTGGLYTNSVVTARAESKGIPIISVSEDTFTTIDRIESVMGKARIRDSAKIARGKDLIEKEFDIKRLLKIVKK
jgi:BioD-like phosphotransacetylase family protein